MPRTLRVVTLATLTITRPRIRALLISAVEYRPDCGSSRSCLALGSDVSIGSIDVHNDLEGSPPDHDAADLTDLIVVVTRAAPGPPGRSPR